jgi:hypothetical protein
MGFSQIYNLIDRGYMRKNAALESIQFQKTDLFNEIVSCIKELRKLDKVSNKAFFDSIEIKQLSDVIMKHTGLSFLLFDNDQGFAVYIPILNNHIFDRQVGIKDFNKLVKEADYGDTIRRIMKAMNTNLLEGGVSLKNSKVSGIFSKITCPLSLPRFMIHDKTYLDEELAACTLHEVGHLFTSFEYLSRTVRTNQALSLMQRVMDKSINFEDRKIVFTQAVQAEKLSMDQDAQKLMLDGLPFDALTVLVINQQIEACKSELGASVYDEVSCEYLADQFVSRHGGGRYLVSMLDKLAARGGYTQITNDYLRVGMSTMVASAWVFLAGLPVVSLAMGIFTILIGSGKWAIASSKYEMEHGYDNDYTRMNRIKHQMVQRLKEPECMPEEKKYILTYLEEVEPIIKKYEGQNNPKIKDRIAFFFSKKHKYDFEFKNLQKDLEEMGNNNLFVMSEKLKALQS